MDDEKSGGPAFPRPWVGSPQGDEFDPGEDGMTLRDYFAGQALAGLAGSFGQMVVPCAELCYKIADAMLEARDG